MKIELINEPGLRYAKYHCENCGAVHLFFLPVNIKPEQAYSPTKGELPVCTVCGKSSAFTLVNSRG